MKEGILEWQRIKTTKITKTTKTKRMTISKNPKETTTEMKTTNK